MALLPIFCVARFSRTDLSMLVARALKIGKIADGGMPPTYETMHEANLTDGELDCLEEVHPIFAILCKSEYWTHLIVSIRSRCRSCTRRHERCSRTGGYACASRSETKP